MESSYVPIENYAVIGDLHTVALVGKNGSIDWCCLPRFDSPSVFGALLDAQQGGSFSIAPPETEGMRHTQLYLPETNILITRFLSVDGVGEITDFMPIKQTGSPPHQHYLIRSVAVVRGSLPFELVCRPAFNYARDAHEIRLSREGTLFLSDSLCLGLATSVPLEADGEGGVRARFTLHANQSVHVLLESARTTDVAPKPLSQQEYQRLFQSTLTYWRSWLAHCTYHGRWREVVSRSALVLKLLTYAPTGAMVAAATTSLPETIGGARNWDYRYTWLRDASFTLYGLLRKASKDPDYAVKKARVEHLYAIADREVVPEPGDPEVIFCVDEFGPLNLQPRPGRQWAAVSGKSKDPVRLPRPRMRATYTRTEGVRHLLAAYDLGEDRLYGHVKPRKTRTRFLEFCRYLRSLYPPEIRIAIICDNFSPHLTTAKDGRVGAWAAASNVEIAYTPANASWLNRIEAQFTALRYFALDGTDHASHKEQASMIRRYIIWRNNHAYDEQLRRIVNRANVA